MKFNGTPFSETTTGQQLFKIRLKGGGYDGHETLCTYGVSYVVFNGERFELNQNGDYVHAPGGLN